MNDEVNKITATNLDLRLSEKHNKDELGALAQTFNQMLDRLEDSFDAQKMFVSNISHELRTPLAAIIAELELALEKEYSTPYYLQTIGNALSDSKKLVRLSDSLLDFAKASYDPLEIVFKEVRIDEVILDACQKLQRKNKEYKFNFIIDESIEEDTMLAMKANPYLLEVAVSNVLENACKYSDDHQCTITISKVDHKLSVTFKDNGFGISSEDMQHIFEPFYRGEHKTSLEGNGIGLPLTHKIITLHKGVLSLTSIVDKGSVFTMVF